MQTARAARIRALSIGVLSVCGLAVLSGCSLLSAPPPAPGPTVPPVSGLVSVSDLTVGQCFNSNSSSSVAQLSVVSCTQKHAEEVFSNSRLGEATYPGDSSLNRVGLTVCGAAFKGFAGISYAKSIRLHYSWFYPSAASWAGGDRTVLCLINRVSTLGALESVTGSLRGAKD